ncbi:hypothetical protein [Clostridium sp. OS1-26]|uniref:hypothetical protein n=1 Tax=Clostridium sp. OS1-26 TaxID=3070681 RepID=UPI0027DF4639|nr:hypothetical protein [Clostridium sp. OS1-26]WML33925.1 hypothetical protein RCG18_21770 [Clostridium sp. OS1-26]
MYNGKKTFNNEVYGKMIYKENFWEIKEPVKFKICNRDIQIKSEVGIYNIIYEEFNMGLMSEKIEQFHRNNPELLNADEAEKIKNEQKEFYKKHLIDNIDKICDNIEEAALRKVDSMNI